MKLARLGRLVGQNVSRSRASFALSSFGIAVGVAAFAFLLALAGGISRVVLGQVFPADRLEVVRPRASLDSPLSALFGGGGPRLDDAVAGKLRARPEVREAFPKMKIAFPARAWGGERMFGKPIQTEIIGDGVDPSLISRAVTGPFEFRDLEGDGAAAGGTRCQGDDQCPQYYYCPEDLGT
ncbi:MAG TPA: ABC transporter permease, partial [Polyangia bacterium]